jgi:hypothetical protein
MKLKKILLLLVFLLAACNLPSPTEIQTPTLTPESSPVSTDTPGSIVYGRVTSNGVGLANVKIYRRFSAYPREQIAITDTNGYYRSAFIGIPGDEMVSIEAELDGYTFDPPYYYWRHYYGHEETKCDFTGVPKR